MSVLPWRARPAHGVRRRRLLRVLAGERGMSMVEVVVALVLLEVIGASLVGLLTSSTAATRIARHRTVSQQAALSQIESIRGMDYKDVGIASGNPSGCIGVTSPTTACPASSYPPATTTLNNGGLQATVATQVSYVNDPGPLSYTSYANYKKITVTVTRNSDSTQLAREVTYVAPPVRPSQSNAVITARVVDYGNSQQMTSVPVSLSTGPSAPRSDTTDASGTVIFAGLIPNPTSGGQAYYDLSLTPPSGYVALYDTVSPAGPAHVQLSPAQPWSTALYIYKPATIYVQLKNFDGTPFTGTAATATLAYNRNSTAYSKAFAYPGSTLTVTSMTEGTQTVQVIPSSYTLAVLGGSFYAAAVTANVPDSYPGVPSHTFTMTNAQLATVTATVAKGPSGTTPCTSATVTVTGGPFGGAPWNFSASATTNSLGQVTIPNVPAGSGYTINATGSGFTTATSTTTAITAPTTPALPNPLLITGIGAC